MKMIMFLFQIECDCKDECVKNHCKYLKANLKCNSHCHSKLSLNTKKCKIKKVIKNMKLIFLE
jgi:hypothetical protein